MKRLLVLIFITTSFLISCQQEKEITDIRVIDLEGNVGKSRKILLSEIAESIEYIPLETTHESSLGVPAKSKLIYENGLLFVYQKGDYFKIFNSAGDYLSTFNRRGNGPQEYVSLNSVVVDSCAEVISVLTHKKIIEYKTNGEYIRSVDFSSEELLKDVNYSGMAKIGSDLYLLLTYIQTLRDDLEHSALLFDSNSKVLLKIPYPENEKKFLANLDLTILFSNRLSPMLFTHRNCVRIINGTDESIVSVNDALKIDTVFRLNYGKYSVKNFPGSYNSSPSEQPFFDIHGKVFESSSFLFFNIKTGKLPFKHWEYRAVSGKSISAPVSASYFNKKTGQFSFIEQIRFDEFGLIDDLEGGPSFWPVYISQDDYMVNYVDAIKFIEYAENNDISENLKKVAENLKETDNMLLVRVKLKK